MAGSERDGVETWSLAHLHLQEGDVLTSKKGVLFPTHDPKVFQAVHRFKLLRAPNFFVVLGEKRRRVDAVPVSNKTAKRS
jgi:hypothetical protein